MLKVTVTEFNNFLFVKPACLSALSDELTYGHKSFEFSQKEKKRVLTITPRTVYSYDQDRDTLSVPAGCKTRVLKALKKNNYTIEYSRNIKTPKLRRKLDLDNVDLKELRVEQRELLKQIVANTHTIGKAATGAGKSFLISYICRIYPNANIVITTDAVDVIKTLKNYLTKDCGEKVGQVGGGKNHEERITVCTLKSLHKLKTLPDILIVDECHVIGSEATSAACLTAARNTFKVVGLSASPNRRPDNAYLIIESICGPIRADISYQTSVKNNSVAQLEVEVYENPHGPSEDTIAAFRLQVDKDRMCIWQNTERNKLITKLVNKKLKKNPDLQILVYTERTEHALYLYQLLKFLDFKLVCGDNIPTDRLEAWESQGILEDGAIPKMDRKEALEQFSAGSIRRVICTRVWQKGVSFPELNILVRADGSASEITADQASGRLSRTNDGQKSKALVIDIRDTFHGAYHSRFKKRQDLYNEHGWPVRECQV